MTPAIVLAAGTSSRYGYANKLLARYQGEAVLVHTLTALARLARPIVVVLGYQCTRVIATLRRGLPSTPGIRFAINRDFRAGMAASLQTGLRALPACFGRVLLCLGDMPGIHAGLVARLRKHGYPALDCARPVCDNRPGHPVLISRRLFAALARLEGDRGAQPVLAALPPSRRRLFAWHQQCLQDTDTPAALRRRVAVPS